MWVKYITPLSFPMSTEMDQGGVGALRGCYNLRAWGSVVKRYTRYGMRSDYRSRGSRP